MQQSEETNSKMFNSLLEVAKQDTDYLFGKSSILHFDRLIKYWNDFIPKGEHIYSLPCLSVIRLKNPYFPSHFDKGYANMLLRKPILPI